MKLDCTDKRNPVTLKCVLQMCICIELSLRRTREGREPLGTVGVEVTSQHGASMEGHKRRGGGRGRQGPHEAAVSHMHGESVRTSLKGSSSARDSC